MTHHTKDTESQKITKNWNYDGNTGPKHWGNLHPDYWIASQGKNQSPVDINTARVIKTDLPQIKIHYKPSKHNLKNNGNTIEIVVNSGNYIEINDIKYHLLQYHFHSISEHTVDGRHYPVEGHFVHKNQQNELAVIGIFIDTGPENQHYKPIWDHLPIIKDEEYRLQSTIDTINLLPSNKSHYQYSGSLTTPPCSEGVKWFVMTVPVQMSEAQIETFKAIYDHNYRPVQPLNGRQIYFNP